MVLSCLVLTSHVLREKKSRKISTKSPRSCNEIAMKLPLVYMGDSESPQKNRHKNLRIIRRLNRRKNRLCKRAFRLGDWFFFFLL